MLNKNAVGGYGSTTSTHDPESEGVYSVLSSGRMKKPIPLPSVESTSLYLPVLCTDGSLGWATFKVARSRFTSVNILTPKSLKGFPGRHHG